MATEAGFLSLNTSQSIKLLKPTATDSISSNVRVIIRVRPSLPRETEAKNGNPISCVSVLDQEFESSEEVAVHLKDQETSRNECYKVDYFFGQEDDNVNQIFLREVSPLVPGIFHGRNATVFAYGATGSGKTYTMQGTDEMPGLMPLTMSMVLNMCQRTWSLVEMSYYEVYMDRCYDLLEVKPKEISVLDDKDGQIHLRGLSRVQISSLSEFIEIFSLGVQRRKVAHTGLNDVSSRSHGVLVISVSTPCDDESGSFVTGKINLIDLAGNEDNRRTCNEGIRLQESAKINQSLFALSNVIYALNNNMQRVPYRESKLTRILQDSLGGASRALMVACLNPGEYQESVHTVSLAARSRHVSNFLSSGKKQGTPKLKVDMEAKLLDWLESKGKAKNSQRMGAFGSPFLCKTPGPNRSIKKPGPRDESSAKLKTSNSRHAAGAKGPQSMLGKNLFNHGGCIDAWMEDLNLAEDDKERPHMGVPDRKTQEYSETHMQQTTSGKEEDVDTKGFDNPIGLSPISGGKIKAHTTSPRKVLSPINSNTCRNGNEDFSFKDQNICGFFETNAATPLTPFMGNLRKKDHLLSSTPLDKFYTLSSNLKSSLVEEYVDFLNTASREEILQLKGIGEKFAEYILELRDTSPLKSLSDLEKIGLSSKQVQNMFNRAARGIFG